MTLVVFGGYMVISGIQGWGWFLFIALLVSRFGTDITVVAEDEDEYDDEDDESTDFRYKVISWIVGTKRLGYSNELFYLSLAKKLHYTLTNHEIETYARSVGSKEDDTRDEYYTARVILTEFKLLYCTGIGDDAND